MILENLLGNFRFFLSLSYRGGSFLKAEIEEVMANGRK